MPHPRKGTGDLPPNPKQWVAENHGLDLRAEIGVGVEASLPHMEAFARLPGVTVHAHGDVPAAAAAIEYFRKKGRRNWSGLALPNGNGEICVLYNDAHPPSRVRATLMEEFFHIRLEHRPSELRLLSGDGRHRSHDRDTEFEAYGCGAAALVPYRSLKQMHRAGRSPASIAQHFEVSEDLVVYRLQVTRLVRKARR